MKDFNFIDSQSPQFIEEMYEKYQEDPGSVDATWRSFFQGFEYAQTPDVAPKSPYVDIPEPYSTAGASASTSVGSGHETAINDLIEAYRKRGHLCATNNPLGKEQRIQGLDTLDPSLFGFSPGDMSTEFVAGKALGVKQSNLKNIVSHLQSTYCGNIGVEYKYITDPEFIRWMQERMEPIQNCHPFTKEEKHAIYEDMVRAEVFESFLHKKYVGKKRFSLEGATALIPALESLLDYGGGFGVEEFVIGMAHRGRLNVMANVLRKNYDAIFDEFEGASLPDEVLGSGDVKYHLGFSSDRVTPSGNKVHISLCPNPSHLEAIDPVLMGTVRSKQYFKYAKDKSKCVPIAIHGDAAFSGQGVVMEVINMSNLEGYSVGGTIHIIVNNQVGFTTHTSDSRSTTYCTDMMKMLNTPIFHVNGDDPEAVVHCMHMAMEIRAKFQMDVVVDILAYRKYGHNESDEPRFTQPHMYEVIDSKKSPAYEHLKLLLAAGNITEAEAKKIEEDLNTHLATQLEKTKQSQHLVSVDYLRDAWSSMKVPTDEDIFSKSETGANKEHLMVAAKVLSSTFNDFTPVKKLERLLKQRKEMADAKKSIDWGFAENLAYATLLQEGTHVRITGQDVRRGTFTHRHACWYDAKTQERYIPMNHIQEKQEELSIYDSLLSEYGVMGFEFGYSLANPNALTVWEAQFGDFANGAQIMIDQFIASSEFKWQRMSGLVLLLPHGYEGQGPEHSSARLERFLQLCAENNMTVANMTNPAQIFHILRRQMKRNFRRPLVIMSPKSLLRHPKVVCEFEDLEKGRFFEVLPDYMSTTKVERLVFCSGKIFFDLENAREENKSSKVGLVRLEQIYPFPKSYIEEILAQYSVNVDIVWAQEEPENMGAWHFVRDRFLKMDKNIRVVSRPECASTATGSEKQHIKEQQAILTAVWEGLE